MNIIINQTDLDHGLSPGGTYTAQQLKLLNTTWNPIDGFNPPVIGKRCRAELMQEFISMRNRKKIKLI